jgi:hypothetical protein
MFKVRYNNIIIKLCYFYDGIQQQGSSNENTCGDWSLFNLEHFYWHGVHIAPSSDGVLMPRSVMVDILNDSPDPGMLAVAESAVIDEHGKINSDFRLKVKYEESIEPGSTAPLPKYQVEYETKIILIEENLDDTLPRDFNAKTQDIINSVRSRVDLINNLNDQNLYEITCHHANYVLGELLQKINFYGKSLWYYRKVEAYFFKLLKFETTRRHKKNKSYKPNIKLHIC